jgi:myo-inositol-1(or 4)-monophosphatase
MKPSEGLLKSLEAAAIEMVRGAGELLAARFGKGLEVEFKDRKKKTDPLTEADRESQGHLREAIERQFPEHGILGEEALEVQGKEAEFLWVVDPLDGTTNFLRGLSIYGVSVGVLHAGRPVAGAITIPGPAGSQIKVFHARAGGGAFLDGQPIHVGEEKRPTPTHLVCLPGRYLSLLRFVGDLRRHPGEVRGTGSVAFELAHTALGTFQYALFLLPKVWDVAAGVLLVKEAGGEALMRREAGTAWRPLERFGPDDLTAPRNLDELRKWRASLIVGNRDVVRFVTAHIRRPFRLRSLPPGRPHPSRKTLSPPHSPGRPPGAP